MKRKGFTLIELMIVVAIIGVLASIAIPKFADLIFKSNCGNKPTGHECLAAMDRLASSDGGGRDLDQLEWLVGKGIHVDRAKGIIKKLKEGSKAAAAKAKAEVDATKALAKAAPVAPSRKYRVNFQKVDELNGKWLAVGKRENEELLSGCFRTPILRFEWSCIELYPGADCGDRIVPCD